MLTDPGVLHSDSFAKYAVAFFRISRSSSARRSCLAQPLVLVAQFLQRGVLAARRGWRSELGMPVPQALVAHAHGRRGRLERVAFLDHQPHRIPLELFTKPSPTTRDTSCCNSLILRTSCRDHYPVPAAVRKSWAIA